MMGSFSLRSATWEKVGVPSNWIQPPMTFGQIAEIVTMAILGGVLKKFGWRTTMIIGILGHAAAVRGVRVCARSIRGRGDYVVHGVCYAFFFATLYIFVDAVFPKMHAQVPRGCSISWFLASGPSPRGSCGRTSKTATKQ